MMSSVSNLIGAADFPAAVTKIGLGLKPVLPRGGRPRPSTSKSTLAELLTRHKKHR